MCCFNNSQDLCKFEVKLNFTDIENSRDGSGNCWFHSSDFEWKKKIDGVKLINDYLSFYEKNEGHRYMDFSGAYFDESINYLLSSDIDGYNIVFDNCIISSPVKVRNKKYECTLSFKSVICMGDFSFRDVEFDGVDLSGIEIRGHLFLTNTTSKSYFYLENACLFGGLLLTKAKFNHILSLDNTTLNSDSTFRRTTFVNNCEFNNQVTFRDTIINRSFVMNEGVINGRFLFENTRFSCDLTTPIFASVQFSNVVIADNASVDFIGKELLKIFDESLDVVFNDNVIRGDLSFEYANLQKVDREYRKKLIDKSLEPASKVYIGPGCLKYFNQTPIRTVRVNKLNQNLVQDICNTFSKYFSSSTNYTLGVEIVERNEKEIKYFYYSDEAISNSTFIEMLKEEEFNMWALLYVGDQLIERSTKKKSLRDKALAGTDIVIDLASILLKVTARIAMLNFDKNEIQNILNSASLDSNSNSIKVNEIKHLKINQTIILGLGNSQNVEI